MDSPARAFTLATVSAAALWAPLAFVHLLVFEGAYRAFGSVPYLFLGGVLFVLPAVTAVVSLVALPLYLLLRRIVTLSRPLVVTLGGVIGLAASAAVAVVLGDPESAFLPPSVGLATGAAAGWIWCVADGAEDRIPMGRGAV